MKRFFVLCIVMIALGLCCQSCRHVSHNFTTIASGKVVRLGISDYGLLYVNGLVVMEAVRENTETVVETNDGDGANSDPTMIAKGIRTIRFKTNGQVTGYLKDLCKKDPETARKYIEQMPKLYKANWDAKQDKPIDVDLIDVAKKAQEIIDPFDCNGDCNLQGLWKNNTIAYQQACATKLLNYTDDKHGWEGDLTTFRQSIRMFLVRMAQLTAMGRTTTCMRVKYAIIKDNQITDMNYVMINEDGTQFDTHCPECVPLEQ